MSLRLLEMLDLVSRQKAVDAITNALDTNFNFDKARRTQNEIKHRFNVCLGLVGVMRNEIGWSWQRIRDELPFALRSMLDSNDWTPSGRTAWSADKSSSLIVPGAG